MRYGSYKVNQDVIQESVRMGILLEESLTELLFNERVVASLLKKLYTTQDVIGTDRLQAVIAEGYIHYIRMREKWIQEEVTDTKKIYQFLNRCVSRGWQKSFEFGSNSDVNGRRRDTFVEDAYTMPKSGEQRYITEDAADKDGLDEAITSHDSEYFRSVVEKQLGKDAALFYSLVSKGWKQNEISRIITTNGTANKGDTYKQRKYRTQALKKIAKAYGDII